MTPWHERGQDEPPACVRVGHEVVLATSERRPLVALESAVITHGLPYPHNINAAASMEAAVREAGATPATCLILDGELWIGASLEQAEAAARDLGRQKASVRDLGMAIVSRHPAGLTVSATLFAAQLAGIRVFATGGIGGVHVPADTGDVSADLLQLSRTPVITVCAGAKSVLDIPRTLETLETLGVPVFGYRTSTFPAFYLTSSEASVPRVESVEHIARIAMVQWDLGHESGIVLGNPIAEDEAISQGEWDAWIEMARVDAARDAVRGKDVTPFLLGRVAELSEGRTVRSNLALLSSNARLAGEIASHMARSDFPVPSQ